uniref:Uncharacterized protein n=1 Tax=Fusarium oxysporum (strain Fo5176) TaxID=660025 RepID=A0A0D2Y646_FUSOF
MVRARRVLLWQQAKMERSLILPKNQSSQALLREKIHSYETSRFSVIQRITQWKMAVGTTNGENGQWYQDEAGHDLAITWMANWPSPKWPSRVNGWAGQQSITREIFTCKDGGSGQHPILELKTLASGRAKKIRTAKVTRKGLHINSSNKWTSFFISLCLRFSLAMGLCFRLLSFQRIRNRRTLA